MPSRRVRIRFTVLGIGERVGNVQLDQLMVNLKLQGVGDTDLSQAGGLVDLVSRVMEWPVPLLILSSDGMHSGLERVYMRRP